MGMSRCYSLMKCMLILFSLVLLAVGVGACGACAWAAAETRAGAGAGRAGLLALAAWGAALALAALAALAAAATGSASLLAAAFALLALTAVAEGAAAWWGAAHAGALRGMLAARLRSSIALEYGAQPAQTQVVDALQRGLQCCGSDGAGDWAQSAWALALRPAAPAASSPAPAALDLSVSAEPARFYVPKSCCKLEESDECDTARLLTPGSQGAGLHAPGCAGRALAALAEGARAPLLVGAGLLAAHALAAALALALALAQRPDRHYKA